MPEQCRQRRRAASAAPSGSSRRRSVAGGVTRAQSVGRIERASVGRRPYRSVAMRLADALSLRSRRRKLDLFLERAPSHGGDDRARRRRGRGLARRGGRASPAARRTTSSRSATRGPSGSPRSVSTTVRDSGRGIRASRTSRATRARCPFPDGAFDVVTSNAVIEHVGDRGRQEALRPRGAARRQAGVPHDAEPMVPDRGAHPPPARPLAARIRLAHRRLPPRWARPGRSTTTSSAARDLRALFPVPVRIVNLGMTLVAIT